MIQNKNSKEKEQINKQLISIVVPIYNIEQWVPKCIDSLMNQTYVYLEIILVDDESQDSSGKICDKYAATDSRIKVIHKQNGGLSDARNAGINISTGEYVAFIDGDDFVAPNFIKELSTIIEEDESDIACCSYYKSWENGRRKQSTKLITENHKIYSNIEAIKDIFTLHSTLKVITCNKIYKRSLFIDNNIRFPVGKINEDNLTTYKLMFFSKKISFIGEPLLFYRQRSGSIMHRNITLADLQRRENMIVETRNWLISQGYHGNDIIKQYRKTMFTVLLVDVIKNKQFGSVFQPIVWYFKKEHK